MKLDQLVGESFNLNVKEGDVKIKSLYVVDSNIDVENGDLTIKQVHQNCNINIQNGNLDIGLKLYKQLFIFKSHDIYCRFFGW